MQNLFETLTDELISEGGNLAKRIATLPLEEQIRALNEIHLALHKAGPFSNEPTDCVLWVSADNVMGNDYNPNTVAPPEMRLLETSIKRDGYTQPIVVYPENDGNYTVIDGFHRTRVGKESKPIRKRLWGYLPVTINRGDQGNIKDRMAATIRHNRARGVHGVEPMIDIVANLIKEGWTDSEVASELGMDADEVLRFKQAKGLPELFKDQPYSKAWE
jgi:ParB-like chromosome segregation protein Spo0J